MSENRVCTIIDVDGRNRRVKVYNYTRNFVMVSIFV